MCEGLTSYEGAGSGSRVGGSVGDRVATGSEASGNVWGSGGETGVRGEVPRWGRWLTYHHIEYMVFHMKTTLNIDDQVMQRLREEAARQGRTMSELVEAGLRRLLDEFEEAPHRVHEPLPRWQSGGALVDVSDREALYDRIDAG